MQARERVAGAARLAVRHAGAYGDLIRDDVERASRAFSRQLWAGVVLTGAAAFAIAMACVWAIAAAWDTTGRFLVIAALFGAFVLTSVGAFVVLKILMGRWPGLLPATGLEMRKDRLLLEDLLARASGELDA